MGIQDLKEFDAKEFVSTLESALVNSDDSIETTNFVEKTPKRNPFGHRLHDREVDFTAKCNLLWTAHGRGLAAIAGLPKEINLGYIFVEKGYTDASSDYCGSYESMWLRLKHPLELVGGQTLPPCSIKMFHEAHECEAGEIFRSDHIRRLGLFWQKADLSFVLPTSWFLRQSDYGSLRAINAMNARYAVPAQ